eukprot:PhF_6_TR39635/c1_g1_i1/m.58747
MNLSKTSAIFKRVECLALNEGLRLKSMRYVPSTMTKPRITSGPLPLLYHGTSKQHADDIESVSCGKFTVLHRPRGGGALSSSLGDGVYVTPHIDMAVWFGGKISKGMVDDVDDGFHIFACEVLLGEVLWEEPSGDGDCVVNPQQQQSVSLVSTLDDKVFYCVKNPDCVIPRFRLLVSKT